MKNVGIVGIGDMGSGLAKNLIKNGFSVIGLDLLEHRKLAFEAMGGQLARDYAEIGRASDAVFVMVMNGTEAKEIILGENGLVASMEKGGAILLTATIKPTEAREIGAAMAGSGIDLIDSPVSGGFPGAQGGSLTLMAAAPADILAKNRRVMEAVSKTIHHVGSDAGMGQTVKACLQSLIGSFRARLKPLHWRQKRVSAEMFCLMLCLLLARVAASQTRRLKTLLIGNLKALAAI